MDEKLMHLFLVFRIKWNNSDLIFIFDNNIILHRYFVSSDFSDTRYSLPHCHTATHHTHTTHSQTITEKQGNENDGKQYNISVTHSLTHSVRSATTRRLATSTHLLATTPHSTAHSSSFFLSESKDDKSE